MRLVRFERAARGGTVVRSDDGSQLAVAEAALAQERYQDAITQFNRVLEADSTNAQAKLGIAEAYLATGSAKEALALFSTLTDLPNVGVSAVQGQGLSLVALREEDKALETLTEVVHQNPSRWRAWNALARLHDQRHEWEAAGHAYDQAIALAPTTPSSTATAACRCSHRERLSRPRGSSARRWNSSRTSISPETICGWRWLFRDDTAMPWQAFPNGSCLLP